MNYNPDPVLLTPHPILGIAPKMTGLQWQFLRQGLEKQDPPSQAILLGHLQ